MVNVGAHTMRPIRAVTCALLLFGALACPVWATPLPADLPPAPCHCTWEEIVPPPNLEPDPPQTEQERLEDLAHEPPAEFALLCLTPPVPPPPIQTAEPGTLVLAICGVWVVGLRSRLAYWRTRWQERQERRAVARGRQTFSVYDRLRQLQQRARR